MRYVDKDAFLEYVEALDPKSRETISFKFRDGKSSTDSAREMGMSLIEYTRLKSEAIKYLAEQKEKYVDPLLIEYEALESENKELRKELKEILDNHSYALSYIKKKMHKPNNESPGLSEMNIDERLQHNLGEVLDYLANTLFEMKEKVNKTNKNSPIKALDQQIFILN